MSRVGYIYNELSSASYQYPSIKEGGVIRIKQLFQSNLHPQGSLEVLCEFNSKFHSSFYLTDYPDLYRRYSKNKVICKQPSATIYLGQEKNTGEYAALKQFYPEYAQAFDHEFNVLQKLQGHPNIIKLKAIDPIRKVIIEECMYQNILQLYQSSQYGTNEIQAACLLLQGAMALHHLHSHGYVHRDIKPENLMFQRSSNLLKLIDFGWTTRIENAKTHECCTRWYQAPESLLELGGYTAAIDIFGLGCTIAEFLQMRALFEGQNQISHLYKIFEILGVPKQNQWPEGYNRMKQLGLSLIVSQSKKSLGDYFASKGVVATPTFIDILERMLELNPKRRITALDIIKHPYFTSLEGFSAKQHLPPEVYNTYQKYFFHQSLTQVPRLALNQIKNVTSPLNKLPKIRFPGESQTSILDSAKKTHRMSM